jgi:transposase
LARYARQTERWQQALLAVAHASSAEVAARVAGVLGFRASPDTLIRRQRAEPFAFPAPRVPGVDEFALRRGCRYGTRLVDLEQRRPIAGLEGRTTESLTTWLQAHPTVAIVVRECADAYALAGHTAAPDALQVADRFHLLRNVGDALKAVLRSQRGRQPAGGPVMASERPARPVQHVQDPEQPTPRKHALWEAVQQRWGLGQSLRQIARGVGVDRRTVRKYMASEQPPVYPPRRPRPTQLGPYLGYLAERWTEGCHNARRLH